MQAQFFKPSGKPEIDRRRRMAEALTKQGQQPTSTEMVSGYAVKQSPLAGLARALQTGLGGYEDSKASQMEQQKADAARQTMADALGAYNNSQAGGTTQIPGGEKITWNKTNPDQANQMLASMLMGNEDTYGMGANVAMNGIEDQQQRAQAQQLETIRNQITPYQQQSIALEKQRLAQALMPKQTPAGPPVPQQAPMMPARPPKPQVAGPPMPVKQPIQEQPQMPPQNVAPAGPPAPTPHGEEYLKTLEPQMAAVVKLIGDSKEKSSTVLSRLPAKQKLEILSAVNQYNPDYNANKFTGQGAFLKGPTSDKIRSLNVSISHINDTLGPAIDALENGDIKMFNKFANAYAEQTGNPAPTNFDAAKQVVANEVIKAIVNTGGGQGDREEAQKAIDRANSPAQLKGVASTYTSLLGGQLKGFEQQYQATGGKDFDETFLNKETRQALTGDAKTISSDEDYDALPSGSEFIDPQGKKRRKP